MLGMQKSFIDGKNGRRRVKFKKFLLQGEGEENALLAKSSLNCDCRDGKLRSGVGFAPHYIGNRPVVADMGEMKIIGTYTVPLHSGDSIAVFVGEDGYLYIRNSYNQGIKKVYIGENPSYHVMRIQSVGTYHLFVGGSGAYYTTNGNTYVSVGAGTLCGGCAAGKRFFILYKDGDLCYSAPFSPSQWEGESHQGGKLYLPVEGGQPTAIAAYGSSVYIFTERIVYRLKVKAKASDFELEQLFYEGGVISPCSAIKLGAGVFFLAEDGVYRIKGDKIERLCKEIPIHPTRGRAVRVGFCGDALLAQYLDEYDKEEKRLVVHTDGSGGYFIDCFGTLGGSDCFFEGELAYRFEWNTLRGGYYTYPHFETGWQMLGSAKPKILKALTFHGKGTVLVRLYNGSLTRDYTLSIDGEQTIRVQEKGIAFAFRFMPRNGGELESMTVEYDYLER